MKTLVYIRVSTRLQDGGLETQKIVCREYTEQKGWSDTKEFIDFAESGRKESRKAFDKMRAYMLSLDEPFRVVVYKEDRIARDFVIGREFQKLINATESELYSPFFGKIDLKTSAGKFQFDLRMLLAENEVNQFMERSRYGMISKMKRGFWVFQPPYGYMRGDKKGDAMKLKDTAKDLKICLEKFSNKEMSKIGVYKYLKNKNHKISQARVYELFGNPLHFYAGKIHYTKWGVNMTEGKHEPLISKKTYEKILNILNSKEKVKIVASKDLYDFSLARSVCCSECGAKFSYYLAKKKFPYYVCHTKNCSEYQKHIPAEAMEREFLGMLRQAKLSKKGILAVEKIFEYRLSQFLEKASQEQKNAIKKLETNKKKINTLIDQSLDAPANIRPKIYEKIAGLEVESETLEIIKNRPQEAFKAENYRTALKNTLKFFEKLDIIWENETLEGRQKMLKLIFSVNLGYSKNKGFRTPTFSHIIEKIHRMGGSNSCLEVRTIKFSNFLENILDFSKALKSLFVFKY